MSKRFIYHTARTIEIVADTQEEADRLIEAELHDTETILVSTEEEDE